MQYRQCMIGGKLQFLQDPRGESDETRNSVKPAHGHPFDEQDEQPSVSKNIKREVEDYHDMCNEEYETSSIDARTPVIDENYRGDVGGQYDFGVNDDMDDTVSTMTRNECDAWLSWKLPSFLRRMGAAPRNSKTKKSGFEADCSREADSCTTATGSSRSSATSGSFGTNYKSKTVPQLVMDIIYDEIVEACGSSSDGSRSMATLKSYKVVKERHSEKVGLTFATNHDEGTVYICEIKKGSKFLRTGLQVGSRVVSINGSPVPRESKKLVRMLKQAPRELVLVAETPKKQVKTFLEEVCRDSDSTVI